MLHMGVVRIAVLAATALATSHKGKLRSFLIAISLFRGTTRGPASVPFPSLTSLVLPLFPLFPTVHTPTLEVGRGRCIVNLQGEDKNGCPGTAIQKEVVVVFTWGPRGVQGEVPREGEQTARGG